MLGICLRQRQTARLHRLEEFAGGARNYQRQIREVREVSLDTNAGTVLKREEFTASDRTTTLVSNTVVAVLVIGLIAVLVLVVRRRRKKMEE